jgi:hypothetical protein
MLLLVGNFIPTQRQQQRLLKTLSASGDSFQPMKKTHLILWQDFLVTLVHPWLVALKSNIHTS